MGPSVGVIHGRFQPLHIGHMEYLLAGKSECDLLVVGITNPDPWLMGNESSDANRGRLQSNPCTFYERLLMVEGALRDAGVSPDAMRIVPFPHSYPERLRYYAPETALYFLSIYDQWGETKLTRFHDLGLRTHVLWRRAEADRVTSGSAIRDRIITGGDWESLVPQATARVIREFGIVERIREASGTERLYRPPACGQAVPAGEGGA